MRALSTLVLSALALCLFAIPSFAEEVPLLDGHMMDGRVLEVTAKGLKLEGHPKEGGTFIMHLSADHIDPNWWLQMRDKALGDDVKGRLELAVWAVEHGLFRQAKALFVKARTQDPKVAAEFKDDVLPGLRQGIASDLVHSAHRTMEAGKLQAANQMLQAVLTRFADTPAAKDAKALLPTVQHRLDQHLQYLAHWQKFAADEKAREQRDQRIKVTDPIVALIRQGHNIMAHMPVAAAQADAVEHTRQAVVEYKEALVKIDAALKAHADDSELVKRLQALRQEAMAGVVQSHVTAGDVYAATGNYDGALAQANELEVIAPDSADAHALRARVDEAQAWDESGIGYGGGRRGVGGGRGGRR